MAHQVVECSGCHAKVRVPAAANGRPRCPTCKELLAWIAEATDVDFDQVIDSSNIAVLVDLWAPWCGPCRQVSPLLEKVAGEYLGKLKLVKVNIDNCPRTQARFGIQAVPTL
ncbi:MAG: thiol reductase thioredoxin, partial [Actinomycetales bacterium]